MVFKMKDQNIKPFNVTGVDRLNSKPVGRRAAIVSDDSGETSIVHIVNPSIPEQGWKEVVNEIKKRQQRGNKVTVQIKINASDKD